MKQIQTIVRIHYYVHLTKNHRSISFVNINSKSHSFFAFFDCYKYTDYDISRRNVLETNGIFQLSTTSPTTMNDYYSFSFIFFGKWKTYESNTGLIKLTWAEVWQSVLKIMLPKEYAVHYPLPVYIVKSACKKLMRIIFPTFLNRLQSFTSQRLFLFLV